MKKEISRLLKKKILFSWDNWETLWTRKDRKHRNTWIYKSRSHRTKYYKRQSNKKVRRTKNLSSWMNYRKAYDYKWTID